jgi:L,D-transpeptidase catalytic domain
MAPASHYTKTIFMNKTLAVWLLAGVLLCGFTCVQMDVFPYTKNKNRSTVSIYPTAVKKVTLEKLKKQAAIAQLYAAANRFDTKRCILIDMSLPSSQNRFFLFHLKKDTIENSGLVTHGQGRRLFSTTIEFSNEPGSYCTSLGKYKIGARYFGKFGLAYKLHGLDKTNSNALSRAVVLHAHECVPEAENGEEICESQGCPTIAPGFLKKIAPVIDRTTLPMLLYIYN